MIKFKSLTQANLPLNNIFIDGPFSTYASYIVQIVVSELVTIGRRIYLHFVGHIDLSLGLPVRILLVSFTVPVYYFEWPLHRWRIDRFVLS